MANRSIDLHATVDILCHKRIDIANHYLEATAHGQRLRLRTTFFVPKVLAGSSQKEPSHLVAIKRKWEGGHLGG
jgi:hypothetical protein